MIIHLFAFSPVGGLVPCWNQQMPGSLPGPATLAIREVTCPNCREWARQPTDAQPE